MTFPFSGETQNEPHMQNMRGFVEGDTGTTDWFATGQAEVNKYLQVSTEVNTYLQFSKYWGQQITTG